MSGSGFRPAPAPWDSESEMRYLDDLGKRFTSEQKLPAAEGYTRYIAAAAKRSNWSKMDRDAVLYYARQRLAEVGHAG